MKLLRLKPISSVLFIAMTVSGCGAFSALDSIVPDNTKEYRKAETMPPLDVPPDLSTSRINDDIAGNKASSATYSEYEEATKNPLASKYNIVADKKPALSGEGKTRHLVVPGNKDVVWGNVLAFWAKKNISIARKDSRIGIMDTEATADNYAYRVRVERDDTPNAADVYVSAAGVDDNTQKNEAMLRQIAEYLGALQIAQKKQIEQSSYNKPDASSLAKVLLIDEANGQQSLLVEQDYSDVWGRVGRILDRKGFSVEDRDRSKGLYFVRYIDPFVEAKKEDKGFFSSLAFWRDDEDKAPGEYYYIKLISDAADTKIMILDSDQARTSSDTAKRLLGLIQEQLAN